MSTPRLASALLVLLVACEAPLTKDRFQQQAEHAYSEVNPGFGLGRRETVGIDRHCGPLPRTAVENLVAENGAGQAVVAIGADQLGGDAADDEAVLAADRPLPEGAKLGRYVVLRVIGAGAMGIVYSAYDPELDRKVALKLLRRGLDEGSIDAATSRKSGCMGQPRLRKARHFAPAEPLSLEREIGWIIGDVVVAPGRVYPVNAPEHGRRPLAGYVAVAFLAADREREKCAVSHLSVAEDRMVGEVEFSARCLLHRQQPSHAADGLNA